ncbi:MAG: hypothetical protein R2820_03185 [Cyclobacteriaceae bacterium]|nr:hypothetical protein [Cyclobacteriaceae bacterium]
MNKHSVSFENLWGKHPGELQKEIVTIWKQFSPGMEAEKVNERLSQLAYVVKNEFEQVVGISTAQKVYVKQLRNYLYSVRLLIVPSYRQPGLASKLIVLTRDFFESIHKSDTDERTIGIITLIENKDYSETRREAIWHASQMVYIGNSGKGFQVRVYYFKDATIN